MKKYVLSLLMALPSILLYSQEDMVIKGTKHITKKQTPQEVLDSLHARFPNAEAVQYYQQNGADAARGWEISKQDIPLDHELTYYTISFKNEGLKYYGLYENDGTLVEAKMEEKLDDLPKPVHDAFNNIAKTRPGWKVVSKTCYRKQNYTNNEEKYEVIAEKGTERRVLHFSPEGKLLKVQNKKAEKA